MIRSLTESHSWLSATRHEQLVFHPQRWQFIVMDLSVVTRRIYYDEYLAGHYDHKPAIFGRPFFLGDDNGCLAMSLGLRIYPSESIPMLGRILNKWFRRQWPSPPAIQHFHSALRKLRSRLSLSCSFKDSWNKCPW